MLGVKPAILRNPCVSQKALCSIAAKNCCQVAAKMHCAEWEPKELLLVGRLFSCT